MFRKNKKENKAKLEHKLYLARENPEPIFDLSDCGLRNVPNGIYSLCKVFLKESLHLEHNLISSLTGGGNLRDLHLLKILNLNDNAFVIIPDEIESLTNLVELYINNNRIKLIPNALCKLHNLQVLDISNNILKKLPENIGNLVNLSKLNVLGNSTINSIPKSICKAQRMHEIQIDATNITYPPAAIVLGGTECIMKYICDDTGFAYVPPDLLEPLPIFHEVAAESNEDSLKEQKLQDFLEIEKNNELLQRQEFELATALKNNREKLLSDISEQQLKIDLKVAKLQQVKDVERFQLIEQLLEVEQNADMAIKQLLVLNREPLFQLLEQEKQEEERLIAAASKYSEHLCRTDVLKAMEELLVQETERFHQHDANRSETAKSILEQELMSHADLAHILQNKENRQAELISQLQEDVELQKVVVGALLERGDARSWGLVQQVRLVELQLAGLTTIELDRRKLKMDEHLTDLAEKRTNLSELLMELLHQQEQRRAQLLTTLKIMEENNSMEDFWLRQYQQLLDRIPAAIREAQKNINLGLAQALLMSGALHCLPFLAHLAQTEGNVQDITEDDIKDAGVTNSDDRNHILQAFHIYSKERAIFIPEDTASAPPLENASAPMAEVVQSTVANECVVCMEIDCDIIFVPCGHFCCCGGCSSPLVDCPLCRASIERKIRIYTS